MGMDELVAKYRGRKAAVYGLGAETPKALADLEENFEVMGLLDGFREDGEMYGKPVIPFGEAVKNGVELIFVAARPVPSGPLQKESAEGAGSAESC